MATLVDGLKAVLNYDHDAITSEPNIAQGAAEPSATCDIFQRQSNWSCSTANMTGKKEPAGKSGLNPILWGSWRRQMHYAAPPDALPIFICNELYHETE
jgi:hypothetical protein